MKTITCGCSKRILLDDTDFDRVSQHNWACYGTEQVVGSIGTSNTVQLSRFILGFPAGKDVDHISHDWHDNRKVNLRICTRAENLWNNHVRSDSQTGIKGIRFDVDRNQWRIRLQTNGKRIEKRFKTKEEAVAYYNSLAVEKHGEFARLNIL